MVGLNEIMVFIIGLITGAISVSVGVGGGTIIVPVLLIFYGLSGDKATATSLAIICLSTLAGTLSYAKNKIVDYRLAVVFILVAVPGSVIGSLISIWMAKQNFKIDIIQFLFAGTIFFIAIAKIYSINKSKKDIENLESGVNNEEKNNFAKWTNTLKPSNVSEITYTVKAFPGTFPVFFGGVIGSILGLGGGIVYIPVLDGILKVPYIAAIAVSTVTIFVSTFVGTVVRFDSVHWNYVVYFSIGSIISAIVLPNFVHKISSKLLGTFFWIFAIFSSVNIFIKFIF